METKTPLRSGKDRLRYSLAFEMSLMAALIPAGAVFFGKSLADMGVLGFALSLKALMISLIYNWAFDHLDARRGILSSDRSPIGRILHAVGFEISLLITSLPLYMWHLDLTLFEAVMTDMVVTSFVVIYTYFFTLSYDHLFPVAPRQPIAIG